MYNTLGDDIITTIIVGSRLAHTYLQARNTGQRAGYFLHG